MSAQENLSKPQFFHFTDHPFNPGEEVMPVAELGTEPSNSNENVGDPDKTYVTTSLQRGHEMNYGNRVYPVKPLGKLEADPDSNGDGFMTGGHLQVLPHTAETLAMSNQQIDRTNQVHADLRARNGAGKGAWWDEVIPGE